MTFQVVLVGADANEPRGRVCVTVMLRLPLSSKKARLVAADGLLCQRPVEVPVLHLRLREIEQSRGIVSYLLTPKQIIP